MRLKQLFTFALLTSLLFSCVKHSTTYERIRERKKHQKKSDCPGLDCGHTVKKK